MKLLGIFRFEFLYQIRSLSTWLYFAVVVFLIHRMVVGNFVSDAVSSEFYVNSPFVIAICTVFGSLICTMVAASVSGGAIARDSETGMHPLIYTTPISKVEYLGGRFLAAFIINLLIVLGVPMAVILAVYLPFPPVDAAVVGPFRQGGYLTAYLYVALPNAFVATSVQFMAAALSRRVMTSYLGSLVVFSMAYIVPLATILFLGTSDIARLIDPVGVFTLVDEIDGWTPVDKSTRMLQFNGDLLWNRVVWIGVSLVILAFTYFRFGFIHHAPASLWEIIFFWRKKSAPLTITDHNETKTTTSFSLPDFKRSFGFLSYLQQSLAIMWSSFLLIFLRRGGLIIAGIFTFVLTVAVTVNLMESETPKVPRTDSLLTFLTAPVSHTLTYWMVIPLLLVIYAGELVWHEREAGVSEITDTTSTPEWALFFGKFMALGLFVAFWMALLPLSAIIVQLSLGYHDHEVLLMFKVLFGLQLPEYLLFAVLALTVHVVVNQKYIGHLVVFLIYVAIGFASYMGVHHKLFIYGVSPDWYYTDIRGFGNSLAPWLWFKIYWTLWAVVLAVAARLLWVRGKDNSLRTRFRLARHRFAHRTMVIGVMAVWLIIAFGGFIFFNTIILNDYNTDSAEIEKKAEYERRYGQFEKIRQPEITDVRLHIELYPKELGMEIRGTYRLVNQDKIPVDSIHLTTVKGVAAEIKFGRPAKVVLNDRYVHYRIFRLDSPLQPGDSVQLTFLVTLQTHGFTNWGNQQSVVPNGTYFTQGDERWLPYIGYQPDMEISKPGDRRKHNLPVQPVIASLYDAEAPYDVHGRGRVSFEVVIGTDADQIAVAPGALQRSWLKDDRRYFQYTTSAPIANVSSFFSAKYEQRELQWKDPGSGQVVNIQLYHHPTHIENLDRLMRAAEATLSYHTKHFGPYPYTHLTIIERGGMGNSLSAEPTTVDYSEAYSRFNPQNDDRDLDMVFAAMAHEVGHQWWGAQLQYAVVEGAGLLSEGLAWYAAMGVVEDNYGPEHLERLRGFFRKPNPIPPVRQSVPLLQGMDSYASYRKGPAALYAMSRYIGRDSVNLAIRRVLEKQLAGNPPLATTLDLYRELQAVTPDTIQYLLHDLFEANTIWELKTKQATSKQTGAGSWEIKLGLTTRKVTVDSLGVETNVPMDDWIDVAVFGPVEDVEGSANARGKILYRGRHRIRTGVQSITVTVAEKPGRAGIDPDFLLIDLNPDDNIRTVDVESN